MKKNYMSKLTMALAMFGTVSVPAAWSQVTTFNYTGAMDTYTVPAGVTSIQIEAWGAQGATNNVSNGGLGGYISGTLAVTPGQVLNIYVGGQNGYNGGGNGGTGSMSMFYNGLNGGGASDVRANGTALSDRVIVAGGGGGAGRGDCFNQHGGAGGYPGGQGGMSSGMPGYAGQDGTATNGGNSGAGDCGGDCSCSPGGGGGGGGEGGGAGGGYGPVFGGVIGIGGSGGSCGQNGDPAGGGTASEGQGGCFGLGGNGGDSGNGGGGGGGGGWYGGGAGGGNWAVGGGGGSSYIDPAMTDLAFTNADNSGDGQIVITVICSPLTTTVSSTDVCEGEMVTLDAVSGNGGTITWDNGVTNNVAFAAGAAGITTFTATSSDPQDCSFSVDITINPSPTFTTSTTDEIAGNDGAIDLTITSGTGPFLYDWDNDGTGDTDDTEDLTGLAGGDYVVVVEAANGCTATSTVTVTSQLGIDVSGVPVNVFPNPTTGLLTIQLNGQFDFVVLNMLGEVVTRGSGNTSEMIDLSRVENGTYFLQIVSEQSSIETIKIVKL